MPIAKVHVSVSVLVPVGEYLDGATLNAPQWARAGVHTLNAEFARQHPQRLVVESIDGQPAGGYDSCCGAHG